MVVCYALVRCPAKHQIRLEFLGSAPGFAWDPRLLVSKAWFHIERMGVFMKGTQAQVARFWQRRSTIIFDVDLLSLMFLDWSTTEPG